MSSAYVEEKFLSLPRAEFLDWVRVEIESAVEELSTSLGFNNDEDIESFTNDLMDKVQDVLDTDLNTSEKGKRILSLIRIPWDFYVL